MAFNIKISLTQLGSEAGPFDLFSNVDNYVVPFETSVPASSFIGDYYSQNVPDGTTNIKIKSYGDCVNSIILPVQGLLTPTVTPTITATVTPTCPITTQYLQVELSDNTKFKLSLWNDAGFTSPTTANCNYTISGTAYGSLGTIYNGAEVITQGQHQHQFDLKPVLLPDEIVTGFTVNNYSTSTCVCPVVLVLPLPPGVTPSPTPTLTLTPSVTPTNFITATPTVTQTLTPTITLTPSITPSVTSTSSVPECICVIFDNQTSTGGDITYQICGQSIPVSNTLGAFQTARLCIDSSFTPFADPFIEISFCSTVTSCETDLDCSGCS